MTYERNLLYPQFWGYINNLNISIKYVKNLERLILNFFVAFSK